jgi:hypothetical protein
MASTVLPLAINRQQRSIWMFGYEISVRSAYQRELIRFSRQPKLVVQSHDGDAVGVELVTRQEYSRFEQFAGWTIDRLGAIFVPRCATHPQVRVTLDPQSNRHICRRCWQD